jgi:hypothetical protein
VKRPHAQKRTVTKAATVVAATVSKLMAGTRSAKLLEQQRQQGGDKS